MAYKLINYFWLTGNSEAKVGRCVDRLQEIVEWFGGCLYDDIDLLSVSVLVALDGAHLTDVLVTSVLLDPARGTEIERVLELRRRDVDVVRYLVYGDTSMRRAIISGHVIIHLVLLLLLLPGGVDRVVHPVT